jgi:hypothetical protein
MSHPKQKATHKCFIVNAFTRSLTLRTKAQL